MNNGQFIYSILRLCKLQLCILDFTATVCYTQSKFWKEELPCSRIKCIYVQILSYDTNKVLLKSYGRNFWDTCPKIT